MPIAGGRWVAGVAFLGWLTAMVIVCDRFAEVGCRESWKFDLLAISVLGGTAIVWILVPWLALRR
jgi:hypothetical protein